MANGLTLRRSVDSLQLTPGGMDVLRDAYAKMQKLSGTDNRSWIYWAGIHGFPQFMCWHHGRVGSGSPRPYNLFLPWHRAYLLNWEHAARDQNDKVSIPWWDWTSDTSHKDGVPKSFTNLKAGTDRNSLHDGPMPAMPPSPARSTRRFPGPPNQLPTQADIDGLMGLSQFEDFTAQLEDIHDQVHGWTGGTDPKHPKIGGDMGSVAIAGFDPIFWSHHVMIDRVWYLWQLQNGLHNIPPDYLDKTLPPFSLTVRDVLDINTLGYEYADSSSQ